jgi:DNA invertase Pin-like site-specific DNA recombinase
MRVLAYVRVSTEDQAQHGVSLADQEQKVMQYAALYGHDVVQVVRDAGYSAKSLKRPGMQEALGKLGKREVEGIVVAKLDRLTRSVRDLADLIDLAKRKDVALISVAEQFDTSTASGRMVANVLGSINQWEREAIGERTKAAISYKRSRGEAYSSRFALYGYEKHAGELVPVPEEQAVIRAVMAMKKTRRVADICRELARRGCTTRAGSTHWHSKVVAKIISDAAAREQIEHARAEHHRAAA